MPRFLRRATDTPAPVLAKVLADLHREITEAHALTVVMQAARAANRCGFVAGYGECNGELWPFEDRVLCEGHIAVVLKARLKRAGNSDTPEVV